MKPIIILLYLKLTGVDTSSLYPKVLPLAYPFAIDNAYMYPVVFLYEAVTLAVVALFLTSQYVIIIIIITTMTGQFAILKTAVSNIKYAKESDTNYDIAPYERNDLYDKLVDCVRSHQKLLT